MGNILADERLDPIPHADHVYRILRQTSLRSAKEAMENVRDVYPRLIQLNNQQFEEVFGFMYPDCDPAYEFWTFEKPSGKASVFEVLAAAAIFCGEPQIELKIQYVFNLFDFDSTKTLSQNAMILLVSACVRAMCRVTSVPIPAYESCMQLAKDAWAACSTENAVTLASFQHYVMGHADVTTFFQKACDPETAIIDKMESVNSKIVAGLAAFDRACKGAKLCSREAVGSMLMTMFEGLSAEDKESLLDFMGATTLVRRSSFRDVLHALVSFDAVDDLKKHVLGVTDVQQLLWLMLGKKPSEERTKYDQQQMDDNGDGVIQRIEWVKYIVVPASWKAMKCAGDSQQKNQNLARRSSLVLREQFDKDEKDSLQGTISYDELFNFIKAVFLQSLSLRSDGMPYHKDPTKDKEVQKQMEKEQQQTQTPTQTPSQTQEAKTKSGDAKEEKEKEQEKEKEKSEQEKKASEERKDGQQDEKKGAEDTKGKEGGEAAKDQKGEKKEEAPAKSAHSVMFRRLFGQATTMKRKAGEVRLHIIEEMAGRVTGEIMNIADDDKNNSIEWSEFKKAFFNIMKKVTDAAATVEEDVFPSCFCPVGNKATADVAKLEAALVLDFQKVLNLGSVKPEDMEKPENADKITLSKTIAHDIVQEVFPNPDEQWDWDGVLEKLNQLRLKKLEMQDWIRSNLDSLEPEATGNGNGNGNANGNGSASTGAASTPKSADQKTTPAPAPAATALPAKK